MADRVPITGTILEREDSEFLYMIHDGQYLFWFEGFILQNDNTYNPYPGQLYGIARVRIGNTGLGSTDGIIYEKEFFYNCANESFFVNIDIPSPYKWTPLYITFERYPLSPNLDWVSYPSGGKATHAFSGSVHLVKIDSWNLE